MKTCSKCKIEKSFEEYRKNNCTKSGYRSVCKICDNKYYQENKIKIKDKQKLYLEQNKEALKNKSKEYYKTNSVLIREKNKKYYEDNKEKISLTKKEYKLKNKERINIINKEYYHKRIVVDEKYKFNLNVKNLIRGSFSRACNGNYKKSDKTEKILGCTVEEFSIYLQNLFTEGMCFQNYGKWHLDHIYPISLAKTKEEIIKLNHYTNFQPLWAEDNIKKSNKII
jgi:hypothetical protein